MMELPESPLKLGNTFRKIEEELDRKGNLFPSDLWLFIGEDLRSLRAKIDHAFDGQRHKAIVVTSAAPKEGKTVVATNLSRALAEASWRTILIDADMRSPDIHSLFRLAGRRGLGEILQEERLMEELIRKTDIPNLEVMAAGLPTEKPAELINSPFTPFLLNELRSRYDYVVLDSAPVNPVADTLVLSKHVDGLLLVIQNKATPREVVKNALDQIHDRNILGVVLNNVTRSKKYYGYY